MANIVSHDMPCALNDTTSSALMDGRMIIGGGTAARKDCEGTCGMHAVELIVNHAARFVKRSKNKAIVDSFPACECFRHGINYMVKLIGNKKE
jgi:hypothetical protein